MLNDLLGPLGLFSCSCRHLCHADPLQCAHNSLAILLQLQLLRGLPRDFLLYQLNCLILSRSCSQLNCLCVLADVASPGFVPTWHASKIHLFLCGPLVLIKECSKLLWSPHLRQELWCGACFSRTLSCQEQLHWTQCFVVIKTAFALLPVIPLLQEFSHYRSSP